jgi:hypothetical protein
LFGEFCGLLKGGACGPLFGATYGGGRLKGGACGPLFGGGGIIAKGGGPSCWQTPKVARREQKVSDPILMVTVLKLKECEVRSWVGTKNPKRNEIRIR